MKFLFTLLAFLSVLSLSAQRRISLDYGWRFHRGPAIDAENPYFNDSKWKLLNVPHDFSMDPVVEKPDYRHNSNSWNDIQVGPFSRLSIGDWDTGQTVGGEGWYRKTFILPVNGNASLDTYLSQQQLTLRFDGVYNHAEVWINGRKVAINVYGYMPFYVNLNPLLADPSFRDPENNLRLTIVVKALNEGLNSRWYAGSGIFRHVWLEQTDKVHLSDWDIFVDGSEMVNKGKDALVKVFGKVFNDDTQNIHGQFCVDIIDKEGNTVGTLQKEVAVASGAFSDVDGQIIVEKPHLWSINDPYLYTAKVYFLRSGEERDVLNIPVGIRKIEFTAENGFRLNGQSVKLRGGCIHHDNGILGAVGIDRADIHRVQLMKAQGYNAVRCSHNLPTESFLNACDSIGMLVIDEVFDQWEEEKRSSDYSHYFSMKRGDISPLMNAPEYICSDYDMSLMVRRDRNHPSIIMWSIGNEIAQRADVPRGKEIALQLNLIANKFDGTRPTTIAVNSFWDRPGFTWEKDSPRAFDNVEIGGYNYEWRHYIADHDSFPSRIMYGSESFPKEMAQNWNAVEAHPYIIGDFVWTAIDYVGEAGLGHTFERSDDKWIQFLSWPWFNSWCGDLDLIGNKKPQSHFRDVLWNRKKLAMAVRPSLPRGEREDVNGWGWTAEENFLPPLTANGKLAYLPVDIRPENYQTTNVKGIISHNVNALRDDSLLVNVYSREPKVQFFVGDSLWAEKDIDPETFTASFTVPLDADSLRAVTVPTGKKVEPVSLLLARSGAPARVVLSADTTAISTSHDDLLYINITVQDADGNPCEWAEIPLDITYNFQPEGDLPDPRDADGVKPQWTGEGVSVICGTGHPYDMHSFRSMHLTTFRGKALAIAQPQGIPGLVTVTVKPKGIEGDSYTFEMK